MCKQVLSFQTVRMMCAGDDISKTNLIHLSDPDFSSSSECGNPSADPYTYFTEDVSASEVTISNCTDHLVSEFVDL